MKPNTPFAFLKNNLLPPAGAALEQYYLPILETETVAVYRYLLASYDQGEKQYLLAQILNHLNIGFPQLLLAFDRLIAMGFHPSPFIRGKNSSRSWKVITFCLQEQGESRTGRS